MSSLFYLKQHYAGIGILCDLDLECHFQKSFFFFLVRNIKLLLTVCNYRVPTGVPARGIFILYCFTLPQRLYEFPLTFVKYYQSMTKTAINVWDVHHNSLHITFSFLPSSLSALHCETQTSPDSLLSSDPFAHFSSSFVFLLLNL